VVSGGLENKQTGRICKTALEVAVANDKIARRYSGLADGLAGVIGLRAAPSWSVRSPVGNWAMMRQVDSTTPREHQAPFRAADRCR
jgi:hypothetical protein